MVRPRTVCYQLGVFLDDQHKGGLPVYVHQAAGVEEHLEVNSLTLAAAHKAAALGILAVALHIDDSVKAVQLNQHLNSISEAHNIKTSWRNIRTRWFCPRWRRNSSVAAVDLVVRVTNKVGWADTYGDMVRDCALCAWATNMARRYALMSVDVTLLVQRTVIISSAFLFDAFTSANEWITNGARGADTVIASWQVDAFRSRCTWIVNRDAFVDVSTDSVRLELVSSWAYTKALLWANIDAVFVLRAGVGGRAVPACHDTVLSNTVIVWWASTSAARETDEVSRAVVVHSTNFHSHAANKWVASVAWRAHAHGLVVLDSADSFEPTRILNTWIVAILLSEVTRLVQGAVLVRRANWLGWLPGQAVSPVWVTVGQVGTLALKGARQIDTARSLGAGWRCQLCALVDVSADTIGQEPVATRTHTESSLPASVDALLVLWARVCC